VDFLVGAGPGAVDLGETVLVGVPAFFHVGVEAADERADRLVRTIEVGKGVEVDDTKVCPAIVRSNSGCLLHHNTTGNQLN